MWFGLKNRIQKRELQEDKEKRNKNKLYRLVFYVLAILFLGTTFYVCVFSQFMQIQKISIQGLEKIEYQKIIDQVNGLLSGKYLKIVPNNNLLLLRTDRMEREISDNFKKIREIEIKKFFPDTLLISVQERKALLVWCSEGNCFLVDENGIAYTPADFESPEVTENNLIIIRDQSQSQVTSDRKIIDSQRVNFLIEVRKGIEDKMEIKLNNEFETPRSVSGDIIATTSDGWKIWLNSDLEADDEVSMLQIILEKNIGKEKIKDLEYIDLRMEGKVYYKLKDISAEQQKEDEKK